MYTDLQIKKKYFHANQSIMTTEENTKWNKYLRFFITAHKTKGYVIYFQCIFVLHTDCLITIARLNNIKEMFKILV